jgi:putative membrane protein
MRKFVAGTIVTAIAFYILTQFLPQYVSYEGAPVGLLVIAAIFGVVNGMIGPVIKVAATPISLMTMGLIGFVINAGLLLLTALIADFAKFDLTVGGFPPTFGVEAVVAAVIGSIVLSLFSTIASMVVPAA